MFVFSLRVRWLLLSFVCVSLLSSLAFVCVCCGRVDVRLASFVIRAIVVVVWLLLLWLVLFVCACRGWCCSLALFVIVYVSDRCCCGLCVFVVDGACWIIVVAVVLFYCRLLLLWLSVVPLLRLLRVFGVVAFVFCDGD